MPTINLTDNVGVEIDAPLNEESGIAKYLKGLKKLKFEKFNFAGLKDVRLDQAPLNSLDTGVTFSQPIAVGNASELTIGAGVSGGVKLFSAKDELLFDPDVYGDPLGINANQFYVGLAATAKFAPEFKHESGDLSFGLSGDSQLAFATYLLFEKDPASASFPTCLAAIKEAVATFAIPRDLDDLATMIKGTVATVEGSGSLKFSGELDLMSSLNPLASISLPDPIGAVKLSSGGSIKVGMSCEISGAFQIRAHKVSTDKVRIGYYRKRGAEFNLKAEASIGASLAVGKFEPLVPLLKALSSEPEADFEKLKKELKEDQVAAIKKAVEAGISRKLEIALAFELTSQTTSEASFLFEAEISKLGPAGRRAIQKALGGDLSDLPAEGELPAGVSLVRSIFTEVQTKKHAVKFNLLGIYNFISVSTLILKGRVMFDPLTGELLITDTVTASKISASTLNFAVDGDKLRKVLAESVLISIAYRCSRLVTDQPQLRINHSYFELHTKTDQTAMKNNLDVFEALGLMNQAEKEKIVSSGIQFGRTTFRAETAYDDELVNALFLKNGQPRSQAEYEAAGRKALGLLVQSGEKDQFRSLPANDDALWKEMTKLGQFNFGTIVQLSNLSTLELALVQGDYTAIMWWATSMKEMSEKLAEVRQFLKDHPQVDPKSDAFTKLRTKLSSKLKEVARNTKSEFGDPWGLVAMDQASGQKAAAEAVINTPTQSVLRKRSA